MCWNVFVGLKVHLTKLPTKEWLSFGLLISYSFYQTFCLSIPLDPELWWLMALIISFLQKKTSDVLIAIAQPFQLGALVQQGGTGRLGHVRAFSHPRISDVMNSPQVIWTRETKDVNFLCPQISRYQILARKDLGFLFLFFCFLHLSPIAICAHLLPLRPDDQ